MEASFVEEVAASLVREFLSKKGLKKTGIMMDEEFPRTALSINNRNELRNVLHLQSLYKQNKAKETPFKTILEIMASYFLELQINQSFLGNSSFLENKASHSRSTESFPPKNFLSGEATGGQTAAEKIKKGTPSYETNEGISCLSRRHCPKPSEKGKARATSDGQAQAEGEKKLCDPLDVSQIPKELSTETRMALREKLRGQQGRIAASTDESQEDSLKRRHLKRLSGICSPSEFGQEATFKSSTSLPGHSIERTIIPRPLDELLSARSERSLDARQNSSPNSPSTRCAKKDDSTVQNVDSSGDDPLTKPGLDRPAEAKKIASGYDAYEKRRPLDVFRKEMGNRSGVKSLQKNEAPFTDLSLGCFNEEWKIQSFTFSENPQLKYGIVQKKGGPCGVLAAVQAHVLQHLIFGDSSRNNTVRCLWPSDAERIQCLVLALAGILWRAGGNDKVVVTLSTGIQQFTPAGKYKPDGILEMLLLHFITKYEDLLKFLQQNMHQFEAGPHGCILLTLSVILSRSINRVRGDMDVITNPLIGAHGYCTQELVNLLLTGKAVSNVFNDMMELDSGNGNITVLKGVTGRSDLGLLSLFEHYDVCQVGCYLKTPRFPIWVVCSESHFSVLFCLRKDLLADWREERRFDLYYYDGLANQEEEIHLTIDISQLSVENQESDLVSPLELCIRTKWKGAVVNWNGTEPIL
ncbi:probable ubiquitin carboxyl-terminal hydrolase MINDY-4 [Protobothrops mucrosquamatus]|uniref:probable ubiquitin carboxyl-terminal hydrolase MINDY-4 n=1 Tax=Protobothrops mucrosquamatus TaxID=103944 RepID=UPI0010FBAA90|nr:probable ubiquitin carboxyl-terminal hydrolase MINDY-4 [Protobothrops mucrosquamatus]